VERRARFRRCPSERAHGGSTIDEGEAEATCPDVRNDIPLSDERSIGDPWRDA
jgi:hypothetical protein